MASLRPASSLSQAIRGNLTSRRLGALLRPPHYGALTRTVLSLIAISGNTVLATFLNGAITVALPSIAKSIDMPQDMYSWPLAMFSLTSGALLLISGAMADAFGRRKVFLVGNVVFGTLCLAISFVTTSNSFIGCCAGLGVGAALLIPAGVGILGSSIPEGRMKNQSFALLGAAQPIGFIIGLILGGLLSTRWQIIFWVLTALTICMGICAFLGLPHDSEALVPSQSQSRPTLVPSETSIYASQAGGGSTLPTVGMNSTTSLPATVGDASATSPGDDLVRTQRLKTFDWFGALMSTGGLVMLTFALADAESAPRGWKTSYVLALIPISALFLASFLLWERRLERLQRTYELGPSSNSTVRQPIRNASFIKAPPTLPLLPPAVWRAPRFGSVIAVIFLAWAAFNVLSYLSTLVYQEVQTHSASTTSVLFLPMVGAGLALNVISGWGVGKFNAIWFIVIGTAMSAAAALILSLRVNSETPYYEGMLWVMILQVGPDIFFPAGNLYACKCVGRQHQALAGSLFNTTVRVATSLGLAISSSIATAVTKKHAPRSTLSLERRLFPRGSDGTFEPSPVLLNGLVRRVAAATAGSSTDRKRYSIDSLMRGYQAGGWFCFACSMFAMALGLFCLRDIGIVGGMEAKEEDRSSIEMQGGFGPADLDDGDDRRNERKERKLVERAEPLDR